MVEIIVLANNFGHAITTDGRPFWIGDFNGDGKADILFCYPGDDNWWLGIFGTDSKIHQWVLADNTGGGVNSVSKLTLVMLLLLMADLFGLVTLMKMVKPISYSITQVMITGGLVLLAQIAKYTNGF